MKEIESILRQVLSNTFLVYFKTHAFHWNVTGMNFQQMHDFFGSLYEDLHRSVDFLAEEIRALDEFAPRSLSEMYTYSTLGESSAAGSDVAAMLTETLNNIEVLIDDHNLLFRDATNYNKQGLADYAAGRIDELNKWRWKIKSFLG
jgi:starvation-inducible DNA-binding protein